MAKRLGIDVGAAMSRDAAKASISLDTAIRQMMAQGLSAQDSVAGLVREIESGQGPLAQFKKLAKQSVTGLTSQRVSIETARRLSSGNSEAMGVWMSTGGSNVCPGCEELHGKKMTADEFEQTHGTNECGANCYCFWMPGETAEVGAFAMRDVLAEHPEWFRNEAGAQPPNLLVERSRRVEEDDILAKNRGKPSDQQKEYAAVIGPKGKVVGRSSGSSGEVVIPKVSNPSACVATHNHPSGGSFSEADICSMSDPEYAFAEIGACGEYIDDVGKRVTARYRCALTPTSQVSDIAEIEKDYDAAIRELVAAKPSMTEAEFIEARHLSWVKLSKERGFLYARKID